VFSEWFIRPIAPLDQTKLERVIKEAIIEVNLDKDAPLTDENVCHTFVISEGALSAGRLDLMRTYKTATADASGVKIWEAALATSSVPTLSEKILMRGIAGNNPTIEAIAEAHKIWPNRPIGCLLSIGTGLENARQLSDNTLAPMSSHRLEVATYFVSSSRRCEEIHRRVCSNFPPRIVVDHNYFRWNVPRVVSAIGIEEWKKIGDVVALTDNYMKQIDMESQKRAVVELLLNPQTRG